MKLSACGDEVRDLDVGVLALLVRQEELESHEALGALDDALGGALGETIREERFRAKDKQTLLLHTFWKRGPRRVLLVGLGKRGEPLPAARLRLGAAAALRAATGARQERLAIVLPGSYEGLELAQVSAVVSEGVLLGAYRFDRYRRRKSDERRTEQVLLLPPVWRETEGEPLKEVQRGIEQGVVLGRSVCEARDLVNEPAGTMGPGELAEYARGLGERTQLQVRVLEADECEELGMGCLIAVGRGSEHRPLLIRISYLPRGIAERTIALVGKGVTFDSGGLMLKTVKGMEDMKVDMAGAAAVLAVMQAVAAAAPPVAVHALVPAAENMPAGDAVRPGDIVRAMNGTTVEVVNTDAEGRLILADAIAYAVEELKVDEIIELSTLTGSCVAALGPTIAGAMSDDETLIERYLTAATSAGEKVWRLPLAQDLARDLEGDLSDLKNVGGKGGGAIQGGLFLKSFAGEVPFLHLDIAGPATASKDSPVCPKGGTGYGVLTLARYLT